ncbi:DegT/DnrJ/EryC1/StrS family aminotransferase [Geobacter hydrogenophilus]|uniref:DegT/DnrJ/EryC1/StrS family aminotransferase n=1 Tax=Geobacter hydrogenophilus TaxID=40983 RepID=UPI001BD95BAD|nr:DegT/DnrJ/EryC1/StrS family aminotransferase [Geobacter hydrogenophilus]MBT0892924.1 DegT/DnrJ/EryC1/StrS family aminotransferase [Geobacter hydrogenophilus]
MEPRIGGRPTAHIIEYLRKPQHPKQQHYPFSCQRSFFYFSSRYALADGIRALGLRRGDTVLLPAYNCGIEIEPFHYFGLRTEFYQIDKELKVSLPDLREKIKGNIAALLVTHYLGFPQDTEQIKAICNDHGVFLIEDCAHALLGSHNGADLGTYGDIAVFSVLKTLPVPNGGVLVVNNNNFRWAHQQLEPSRFSSAFYVADLLRQKTLPRGGLNVALESGAYGAFYQGMNIAKRFIAAARKISNSRGLSLARPDSYDFREDLIPWGTSKASERIIAGTDMSRVKKTRRDNFGKYLAWFLAERPAGITLPFTELPEGVCPLFFPLIFEEEGKREIVHARMKERGITTYPWWDRFHPAVPWDEYPDAVYLKKHLFGLPVHQDLEPAMIERVLTEFADLMQH